MSHKNPLLTDIKTYSQTPTLLYHKRCFKAENILKEIFLAQLKE